MNRIAMIMAALAMAASAALAEEGQWVELFNGKDLTGWTQKGGKAKYVVEDGIIVGSSVLKTPNSFLCTEKEYGDFILELDYKVDQSLNSGVQFRSECFAEAKALKIDGKEVKVAAGRVHGYQYEIDMDFKRGRLWSGGIFDEGRRGWLYPGAKGGEKDAFSKQGAEVTKKDDWNHVRIEAIGDSIKTYLNGQLRSTIQDGLTRKGFIGLQVHACAKEGLKACFRNIRIQEKSPAKAAAGALSLLAPLAFGAVAEPAANTLTDEETKDGWKLLWDGKTGQGWRSLKDESFPKQGWEIQDGVLTISGSAKPRPGDIITTKKYSNFELKVDFKITEGANSGIKIFVASGKSNSVSGVGLEYQILDDEKHPDAKKGIDGNRTIASLYDLIPAAKDKKVNPVGEWNHARILSKGNHVEHWLNGAKVVEYDRGSAEFKEIVAKSKFAKIPNFGEAKEGHILLQDHGNTVSFRNIKIKESE